MGAGSHAPVTDLATRQRDGRSELANRPLGMLFDFGGTLVEEMGEDMRAGAELMMRHARLQRGVDFDAVLLRAEQIDRDVARQRDTFGIETPWISLTRLIHDCFGSTFDESLETLELAYWDAVVTTRPMPGARNAIEAFHRAGIRMGVVSNSSFSQRVIRHELEKHGLANHLDIVVVSCEYAVRKPSRFLFEAAAGKLGVAQRDIWFVGDRLDTDMAGARSAGMTSVWYSTEQTTNDDVDIAAASWDAIAERALGRAARSAERA